MQKIISGIQQIGIGVKNVEEAWQWYRTHFGIDIPIFDEHAEASLMTKYTGDKVWNRHAVFAINLQGGGGFEMWQFTDRKPQCADFEIQLGDLGINAAKIKCRDVQQVFTSFQKKGLEMVGQLHKDPIGRDQFFVKDPYGNLFQMVDANSWFKTEKGLTGGLYGCTIGVSDIEKSCQFYQTILGYDRVVYDEENRFDALASINGGSSQIRRVLLQHSKPRKGRFSSLLGASEIELIQVLDRTPQHIFKNRFWGDCGFIHLCFDVTGMEQLALECEKAGYPFTVNSRTAFDMGEAAGQFSYVEDPDGTLIEFVETHKIPIVKKLGWNLDLKNRSPEKALPSWLIKSLAMNRIKD
jgi:catechol 2,3-dioxygenase-like lactoylglutathione lyase family enzyme